MQSNPHQYSVVHEEDQEYTEKHDEVTVIADTPEREIQMYSDEKLRVNTLEEDDDFKANKIIHSERNNHGAVEINDSEEDEQDGDEFGKNEFTDELAHELNLRSSIGKLNYVNEIPINSGAGNTISLAGNLYSIIILGTLKSNIIMSELESSAQKGAKKKIKKVNMPKVIKRVFPNCTDVSLWRKKNRLDRRTRVFKMFGNYATIRKTLHERGWIENKDKTST